MGAGMPSYMRPGILVKEAAGSIACLNAVLVSAGAVVLRLVDSG